MKYSEIEKKMAKHGCYYLRDGKKHPIWYSPISDKEFQLSHHKSEEVKKRNFKKYKPGFWY